MANEARLKIIIEALNMAKGELNELQKDLKDANGAAEEGKTSFKDVGVTLGKLGVIAAGAGIAVKKAMDFARTGAEIQQTRESFDRLGISIEDLRSVSRGTVDDMTLMSSTLTLTAGASEELQGELLGASPQLLEIAKAANKLNPTLGDTAHMYESIATGIKRSSPLILDNLGIVVKVGEANERYAEQVGKAVEELTAEEKQTALLNATLEAGNRLIEQAGGNVDAATDKYERFNVAVSTANQRMREQADILLGPVLEAVAGQLTRQGELETQMGHSTTAAAYFNSTFRTQNDLMLNAAGVTMYRGNLQELEGIQRGWNATAERSTEMAKRYALEQEVAAVNTEGTSRTVLNLTGNVGNSAEAFRQYQAAIADSDASMWGAASAADGLGDSLGGVVSQGDRVRDAIARVQAQLDKLPSRHEIEILIKKRVEQAGGLPGFIDDISGGGFASGGVSAGGLALVGERGPELVNLPQGAQVMSAPVTNNITNNYNTTVNTRATSGTYLQDLAIARARTGR
ncbi:MAG: hypothetical protein GF364_22750 [Candidatus Lokiarchaeota archaeon]|nr:hypothetical protein [Candidatus Lokiarchaeota archaeon]